ncbi:MAG: hypothetical protein COU98_00545 [Candidatus Staskawiczbacteria bacterium CG10_big_fil_rev_8_21_14_0_10_38_10]|uniref:Uncharacterized protein n=1 Tax=Candidatus Staskawiczbacteria bacterium CG10_big_fil_rev_8_21_14_0_10_38_10 TaxID=1974891 RepID=A0A2H9T1Z0_9BACT|nr:MAG: hypothetical protein COU98_00545 [Candidatus Staskawiczbacteria bacterium CG10_big_fil_rev_8_21_14_0_10_38_10]
MTIGNFNGIKSLFFDNLTVKQTLFKNTFWLGTADGISKFLKFILFIYVARILGAAEYGKFTFALAFAGLFIIFADLGLSHITTREFSQEKEKEKKFGALLSLKILLSLGTLVLILASSFFITADPLIQKLIWILAICNLAECFSWIIFAFLQARQKMEYQAFTGILESLIVVGTGLFILFYFPSIRNLSYSYLFASLVALIFVLILFHFKVQRLSLNWRKSIWKEFLLMSWPIALTGMAAAIYGQTDSVMMGYFGQIIQTGWYNAASRIVWATIIPMNLISISFFPVLNKAFNESKEKLQKVFDYQMGIMIFFALPIVTGGIVLAPKIIDFMYNQSYFSSILALQILILTAGIVYFYNPFSQILITFNQQKKAFWMTMGTAITNVILNLILIPKYSLYGAAVATVITHFLTFALFFNLIVRYTYIKPLKSKVLLTFLGAFFSSLIMYFVISLPAIYNLHIIFSVLFGALIYSAVFFVLRYATGKFSRIYEKN